MSPGAIGFQALAPKDAPQYWALLCEGLNPLEAAFGPEGRDPRPRPQDAYFLVRFEGGAGIGMIWTQTRVSLDDHGRPVKTVAFGMGLFAPVRSRGLGPRVRDTAYDFIFEDLAVHKLESEIYSSNDHSLQALHGPHRRAREEGRQRQTIRIGPTYYDRILFGITRPEWEAIAR